MEREVYTNILKEFFSKKATKAVVSYFVRYLPFLSFGPLNAIAVFLVGKVMNYAFNQADLAVAFKFIDMRTTVQANEFSNAASNYYKERSPENEKALNESFDKLVGFMR